MNTARMLKMAVPVADVLAPPEMTGCGIKAIRNGLHMTTRDFSAAIGLTGENARRTLRRYEAKGAQLIPGPVALAARYCEFFPGYAEKFRSGATPRPGQDPAAAEELDSDSNGNV